MLYIIGGTHRKRKLKSPKGEKTRPTSSLLRETLFNLCQWEISRARFLDLFAGAGAIGLEALSRGARHAVFVDQDRQAVQVIRENIALLKEESCTEVFCQDVFKALDLLVKKGELFEIIFADPPYGKGLSDAILLYVDAHPLLLKGGSLFLEDELIKDHEDPPLCHLQLKSKRRVGRALLRHYIRL